MATQDGAGSSSEASQARLKDVYDEAQQELPTAVNRLVDPYELRVYYYELFECARKICIVGIPVFFANEGSNIVQLTLGLILCFLSGLVISWVKPYRNQSDDNLQTVCQVSIFFALLAKILLLNPDVSADATMAVLLGVMSLVPPIIALEDKFDVLGRCSACRENLLTGTAARARLEPAFPGEDGGVECGSLVEGAVFG